MAKYEIITDKLNNFFTNNKLNIADAKPTQGSYTKGDLVLAKSPTKDVYGWICTQTGSPGTWQVLKSAAELSKGDIEDSLTGQISSHTHASLDINDTRDANPKPAELPKGMSVQFKNIASVDAPWGIVHTNVMSVKGWDDRSGGHATQVSFGAGNDQLPQLCLRVGENDADSWGQWARFFHNKDGSIHVKASETADHGFGTDTKAMGFMASYPGWDKNTLYINTLSDQGVERDAYNKIKVGGDVVDFRNRITAVVSNFRDINVQNTIRFGNGNYGNDNYITYGNGDGSSFDIHNMIIRTWWSIGIRDNQDVCRILLNARAGDVICKGMVSTDAYLQVRGSKIYAQGDDPGRVGAGSIWIKTV